MGVLDPIGRDVDIQISTETGEQSVTGVIIDVREFGNGNAEVDICLEDGAVATIAVSARQYAEFIGSFDADLPLPN